MVALDSNALAASLRTVRALPGRPAGALDGAGRGAGARPRTVA